ncbi:MAG: hypothetical protein AAFV86_16635 [Pseudomonadota bacterium]
MSAGLVTLNAGFRAVRRRAPLLFWPLVTVYAGIGGLGLGLASHYLDARLVFWLVPISTGALMWPVLVDTGLGRLRGTLAAALISALVWWTQWIGWHLAEGARPQGPFPSTAWLAEPPPTPSPYDFDARAGIAAAIAFAVMPPSGWPAHFHALSEIKKLETPRRRNRSRRHYRPEELRRYWIMEPFVYWTVMLIAVWPRRAERILQFANALGLGRGRGWRPGRQQD